MEHVVWLGARGLKLHMADGQLIVTPKTRISDELRSYIREHRDVIVETLLSPDPWKQRRESYGTAYRSAGENMDIEKGVLL